MCKWIPAQDGWGGGGVVPEDEPSCIRKTNHFFWEARALVFSKEHFVRTNFKRHGTYSRSKRRNGVFIHQTNGMGSTNLCCLKIFLARLHIWVRIQAMVFQYGMIEELGSMDHYHY